jgi:hypothetical protein
MNIEEGDRLMWAALTPGEKDVILVSAGAKAIRFNEEEVRPTGLAAGGVMAMKLDDGDQLVGAGLVADGALLLTVTQNGYGKVSPLPAYPAQKRYGTGIVAAKIAARTGPLATASVVGAADQVILLTSKGAGKRVKVKDMSKMGRASLGKPVADLPAGEGIAGGVYLVGTTAGPGRGPKGRPPPQKPPSKKPGPGNKPAAPKAGPKSTRRTRKAQSSSAKGKATAPPSSKGKTSSKKGAAGAKAPTKRSGRAAKPKASQTELELDIPVVRRTDRKSATGPKRAGSPKAASSRQGPAGSSVADEVDLPVKRRTPRAQARLPSDDELDLPAPVKKPRRRPRSGG